MLVVASAASTRMHGIKAATFTASPYAFLRSIRAMLVAGVLAAATLEVLGAD